MVKRFFLLVVCLLGAFFEATVTTLPVLLCLLVVISIHEKSNKIFVLAFISGIVLDVMRVDPVGLRSIFYIIFLFLIFLYERKFETSNPVFVFFASLIGSIGYLLLFQYQVVLPAILGGVFATILFYIANVFSKKQITTDLAML